MKFNIFINLFYNFIMLGYLTNNENLIGDKLTKCKTSNETIYKVNNNLYNIIKSLI